MNYLNEILFTIPFHFVNEKKTIRRFQLLRNIHGALHVIPFNRF